MAVGVGHPFKARAFGGSAHLVLISARSRTTAITGAEPSPVAGSEVWIERLPSWGSNMDWTACTTFSVMDSVWRGNAWWRWGARQKVKFKQLVYKTWGCHYYLELILKFPLKNKNKQHHKITIQKSISHIKTIKTTVNILWNIPSQQRNTFCSVRWEVSQLYY